MSEVKATLRSLSKHLSEQRHAGNHPDLLQTLSRLADGRIAGVFSAQLIEEILKQGSAAAGFAEHTTPQLITEFITSIAHAQQPRSILDPVCGTGTMLKEAASHCTAQVVHGVEIDESSWGLARSNLQDVGKVWLGDVLTIANELRESYDLIIADPPVDADASSVQLPPELAELPFRKLMHLLMIWACGRLATQGTLLAVCPERILRDAAFVAAVHAAGCHFNASIHVPAGTWNRKGSSAQILVIMRGPQEKLFVGELSSEKAQRESMLANFLSRRAGPQLRLGHLLPLASFTGFESTACADRIRELVKGRALQSSPFMELLQKRAAGANRESTEHNKLGLRIHEGQIRCFDPDSDDVADGCTPRKIFTLDESKVDARYLVHWLDTGLGKLAIDAAGGRHVREEDDSLDDVLSRLVCYLPSLPRQRVVLRATRVLERAKSEIREIEHGYWEGDLAPKAMEERAFSINIEDQYGAWLDTLPYPLASILWKHKSASADPRLQIGVLFHFFEALAQFLAVIHISACRAVETVWNETQPHLSEKLEANHVSMKHASFGTWKLVVEYLSKRHRKWLKDHDRAELVQRMYFSRNTDWIESLLSARLTTSVSHANKLRNDIKGHGGALGKAKAHELEQGLRELVDEVRDVFGHDWKRHELLMGDHLTTDAGQCFNRASRLVGTRAQFERVKRTTTTPFDKGRLYILEEGASAGLPLVPLIRMMASPKTAANACYFYNRLDRGGGQRYVSYHFEQEAEVHVDFDDTASIMNELMAPPDPDGLVETS